VVAGALKKLGAQATIINTATSAPGKDYTELSVDLVSARRFDAPKALGALGVRFVLLQAGSEKETSAERSLRLQSATALDQRAGFVRVGETPRGVLWRMDAEPATRAGMSAGQRATAQLVVTVELIVLLAALLLSIPTRASRRAARAVPRAVGVLPERAPRPVKPARERPARAPKKRKGASGSVVIPGAAADAGDAAGEAAGPDAVTDDEASPETGHAAQTDLEETPVESDADSADRPADPDATPADPSAAADPDPEPEPEPEPQDPGSAPADTASAPAKEADE